MNNYEVGIFIQRDGYLGRSPQSMLISHSLTFHSLHSLQSHLSFKLPVKVLHLPLLTTNSLHFYHPHPLSSSSTLIAASSVSLYRLFSPLHCAIAILIALATVTSYSPAHLHVCLALDKLTALPCQCKGLSLEDHSLINFILDFPYRITPTRTSPAYARKSLGDSVICRRSLLFNF